VLRDPQGTAQRLARLPVRQYTFNVIKLRIAPPQLLLYVEKITQQTPYMGVDRNTNSLT